MYKKGYNFERKIKLELESQGWKVIRSGGSKKPDIVAARDGKIIVIECKISKNSKIYLEAEEIEKLKEVADAFNAESMYAVQKIREKWSLVSLDALRKTENGYVFDF
ncbi:MAG: Holliday junction resolvase Hjc [archaeon]|nr:Holliday junction resolvase Hjc [archaeon]